MDAQGRWRTSGLPQAQYNVSVSAPALSFEPRQVELYPQFRGARIMGKVPEPTTSPVARFRAFRTGQVELHGHLLDDQGEGIEGETLVVRAPNGGTEATVTTGTDGAFRVASPLAPGSDCVFFLRDSAWVPAQERGADPGFDRRDLLWHRAAADPKSDLKIRAKRAARVRGRLVDGEGQPVRWAEVVLEESRGSRMPTWMRWTSTVSASDGTFAFRVPALEDPARVSVEGPAGAASSSELELGWGATIDVGDMTLVAAGIVEGVVRDPQQEPVPGARVWLRDWDFGSNQQKSGSVVETVTDRQGRYRFIGVPPGGAWLQVMLTEPMSMDRAAAPFDVQCGDRLQVDLVLR